MTLAERFTQVMDPGSVVPLAMFLFWNITEDFTFLLRNGTFSGAQKNSKVVFVFGTEVMICQNYANGGGGEVAVTQRCFCSSIDLIHFLLFQKIFK